MRKPRHTLTGTGAYVCSLAAVLAFIASFGAAAAQEFPADVTRGKAVYERLTLTNFHRFSSYLKSDKDLLRTIEQGVVFSPMHSWQGLLSETARRDALAYIRHVVQHSR